MFYDKFVSLCASVGKKPTPVAQELGISKGTAASWKRRGNDPTDAYLVKIANYFGVSVDDLRGDAENEKKPTAQGNGLSKSAISDWIKTSATRDELLRFIAEASAKLVDDES